MLKETSSNQFLPYGFRTAVTMQLFKPCILDKSKGTDFKYILISTKHQEWEESQTLVRGSSLYSLHPDILNEFISNLDTLTTTTMTYRQ